MSGLIELAGLAMRMDQPDRELDGLIYRSIDPVIERCWPHWSRDQLETIVPRYTELADTALSLVPAGFYVELRQHSDGWYCWMAENSKFRDATPWVVSQKPTMALAIVPNALLARYSVLPCPAR